MIIYVTKKGLETLLNNLKNENTMLYLKLRKYIYDLSQYYGNYDGEFLFNIFTEKEINEIIGKYDLFDNVDCMYYMI